MEDLFFCFHIWYVTFGYFSIKRKVTEIIMDRIKYFFTFVWALTTRH